eukprot:COSAG05_NODE_1545_length_4590_cov_2.623692_4_plen_143_part_00
MLLLLLLLTGRGWVSETSPGTLSSMAASTSRGGNRLQQLRRLPDPEMSGEQSSTARPKYPPVPAAAVAGGASTSSPLGDTLLARAAGRVATAAAPTTAFDKIVATQGPGLLAESERQWAARQQTQQRLDAVRYTRIICLRML